MMDHPYEDVRDFHIAMGVRVGSQPEFPDADEIALRLDLVYEEAVRELTAAIIKRDLPAVADAIVDSIYVLEGMAVSFGIDLRPIWDAVHAANMAKLGGPKRADGKQLKPPGWQAADIAGLLEQQTLRRSEAS